MRTLLKNTGIYLWTGWCFFAFGILLCIFAPLLYIGVFTGNERIIYKLHFLPHLVSKIALFLFGVRLHTTGLEQIDPDGQYIFISNHSSNIDPLVVAACIRNYVKYIGKYEILRLPVFGFILRKLYFPVKREDVRDRKKVMVAMSHAIDKGASIYFFPEGTRNRKPGTLLPFHDGAFALAIEKNVPLVIGTLVNAAEIVPADRWILKPGTLYVVWHAPIDTSTLTIKDLARLKQKAREIMLNDLKQYYGSKS